MYKETLRPAWAEIDLDALKYNIDQIIKKTGKDKKIIGVVKADAYGHGAFMTADTLLENGICSFAVATLPEAVELRCYLNDKSTVPGALNAEIYVLGIIPDMYVDKIIKYDLIPVISSMANAQYLSRVAVNAGKTIRCLIALDTGMGRIGFLVPGNEKEKEAVVSVILSISGLKGIEITGVMSHMSTADEKDKSYSLEQNRRFDSLCSALAPSMHFLRIFANSAAIMEIPETHYDAVRPGIIMYGLYPSCEVDRNTLSIRPVMSIKADIVHIKEIPAGYPVSYGRKYVSNRPSVIATLPLGYADGLPRTYSGSGKVIVRGAFAPIAGNICMDQFMIDVTDIPGVKIGDEVIIMGTSGDLSVTAEDIAEKTGTINYEILCDFGIRLPKFYKKSCKK